MKPDVHGERGEGINQWVVNCLDGSQQGLAYLPFRTLARWFEEIL